MSYLGQVRRGIDFIEQNLDYDIDLGDVAAHAGISRWHFQRIFKGLTNETLKTYIRARRLANALFKLRETDQRILEIALAAGYDTQESFTRAFKSAFGLTPNAYRKLGDRKLFLQKLELSSEYLRHIHADVSLDPALVSSETKSLVGLRTVFFGVDSEKNNIASTLPPLWAAFLPRLDAIPGRIPGACYGVVHRTSENAEQLEYVAAVEVTYDAALPAGMDRIEIPAATYATFTHKGRVEMLDHTVNYVYSTWLFGSGLRHTYGPDLEIYGPEYRPSSASSVIHYAIPVTRPSAR